MAGSIRWISRTSRPGWRPPPWSEVWRTSFGESLAVLEAQVGSALGPDARIKLVPKRLAEDFDAWTAAQGLSPPGRRIALGSGRHVLAPLLGAYYRDLGQALKETGIPQSKVRPPGMPPDLGATGHSSQTPAAPSEPLPTESPWPSRRPRGSRATAARLAELLAGLPADALKLGAGDSPGAVAKQTLRLLGQVDPGLGAQPLAPVVEERIEATCQVLGQVTATQAVTPRSAAWAGQLGLRILNAAIAEPEFFRPPGHPLLQLLGRLDQLSQFLPTDPRADDAEGLAGALDTLVQQALERDPRDPECFQPLIESARTLERFHGEHFRRDAAHAICQLEGRDRRRAALRYVRVGLEQRFAGRPIHRVVAEVIDTAWSTLLQLRYLREGEDGTQLARAWYVIETLVALCSGEPGKASTGMDALEPELIAGLTYLGFDSFLAEDLTQRVREAARLADTRLRDKDACPSYQPSQMSRSSAKATLDGLEAEVLPGLSAQIDALRPGGVMRLRDSQQPQRLIWASPDRAEYAFLGGHQGELRSFSREALIMGLHSGDLELKAPNGDALSERVLDATLREMQERLRYHETRDPLTGLCNQSQLTGRLAEVLGGPQAELHLLGFLDVDHFDAINSTCDYGAGEQLLKAVAGLIRQRLDPSATLAFFGGRRFGFILPHHELDAAREVCEQLCRDIYGLRFEWQGKAHPVTGSIGAVLARPGADDPNCLLSAAAVACTTAQECGGNRLQMFSDDDEAIGHSRERVRWLALAEDVIRSERIRLRVQMIAPLDPESGLDHHHEVLIQVFDGQGQELDLGRFIAAAETFHLMGQLDRLVVRKALTWAGENRGLLGRLGSIAINLSGVSLLDPNLVAFIRTQLEHSRVARSRVSFGVTETAAIAHMGRAAGILRSIRGIGCRVALDDFGVGISSYGYLKSLPVDFVKLDGLFIRDLATRPQDRAIVKSLNAISHLLGIRTIAKRAEKKDIIERLAEIGVDFVQGYAVRPPLFLDEVGPDY